MAGVLFRWMELDIYMCNSLYRMNHISKQTNIQNVGLYHDLSFQIAVEERCLQVITEVI